MQSMSFEGAEQYQCVSANLRCPPPTPTPWGCGEGGGGQRHQTHVIFLKWAGNRGDPGNCYPLCMCVCVCA